MKHIVPLLLGPLVVAAFALAYWGPVRGYRVECSKDVQITCAIERETSSATTAHRFILGNDPKAVVRVQDVRKGPDRVLRYLVPRWVTSLRPSLKEAAHYLTQRQQLRGSMLCLLPHSLLRRGWT